MLGAAAVPKAIAGTELYPLTKGNRRRMRARVNKTMWGDKYWLRGNTATSTLLNKAHRVDATAAEAYHVLSLWRR